MAKSHTKKQAIVFSKRELQVIKLICNDKSNAQIAKQLKISTSGVDFHRQSAYRKIKCHTSIGLFRFALKQGLVSL